MGREAEAQTLINELLETSAAEAPGKMALVYAAPGEGDSAFEWLEEWKAMPPEHGGPPKR